MSKNNVCSMTASARSSDSGVWGEATWEIRSVNHRFLDCSIRLPDFLSFLEADIREILRTTLQRGRIDCYLKYLPDVKTGLQFTVDENLLEQLLKNAAFIEKKIGKSKPIDPISVLTWPNIIRQEKINAQLARSVVLNLLKKTLEELITVRRQEGLALKRSIEKILSIIEKELLKIKNRIPQVLHTAKKKINAKFHEIKIELDQARLEQEIVLFVHRTDVTEELDRLEIHLQEFKRVLNSENGIGKRLDFLVQELNRETNTLASKSADAKITQSAIEIKVLLEQIREQTQNLE